MEQKIKYKIMSGQILGIIKIVSDIQPNIVIQDDEAVFQCDMSIPVNFDIHRIKNERVVLKPKIDIFVSKNNIVADGVDETKISVSISDCLEGEIFNEVAISVSPGGMFVIPLIDNTGSIRFSCTTPGKYLFKAAESIFRSNEIEVVCNADQSS